MIVASLLQASFAFLKFLTVVATISLETMPGGFERHGDGSSFDRSLRISAGLVLLVVVVSPDGLGICVRPAGAYLFFPIGIFQNSMTIASCSLFGSAHRVRTGRSIGSISGEASIRCEPGVGAALLQLERNSALLRVHGEVRSKLA